jgi:alkylhydroperoxidase family enzyme
MNCKRCSAEFAPVRVVQVYCSKRCANAATKARKRSGDTALALITVAKSGDTAASDAPTGLGNHIRSWWTYSGRSSRRRLSAHLRREWLSGTAGMFGSAEGEAHREGCLGS